LQEANVTGVFDALVDGVTGPRAARHVPRRQLVILAAERGVDVVNLVTVYDVLVDTRVETIMVEVGLAGRVSDRACETVATI
jgi:hypothetical protein